MINSKLSEVFAVVKPEYIYLKLKPNNSIRNNSTHKLARSMANLYKNILENIEKKEEKIVKLLGKEYFVPTRIEFHPNAKISYYIYMEHKKIEFYFIVPKHQLLFIKEKITDVWSHITIEQVESIPFFSPESSKLQIYYKKEDALSLATDRRNNDLLHSNLNVVEMMEENDKLGIFYNFIPTTQFTWRSKHRTTIEKYKSNKPIERDKTGWRYIFKWTISAIDTIMTTVADSLLPTSSTKQIKSDDNGIINGFIEALNKNNKQQLTNATLKKSNAAVLDTQIVVLAESSDKFRQRNQMRSLAQSFDTITADNELTYKPHNKHFSPNDYSIGSERNLIGDEEAQNFLSIAGRDILEKHSFIERVESLEAIVPEDLQKGILSLGLSRYRGHDTRAYFSEDPNYRNLLALIVGASRSGKSTFIENVCVDAVEIGKECVIIFDFIENCEMSDNVAKLLPKEKILEIRCDDLNNLQGMGYNEVGISNDVFTQYNNAKRQTANMLSLIDSINSDEGKLSPKMSRYLESASLIAFINNGSIKDVFNVLLNPQIRAKFYGRVPKTQYENLSEYMESLKELDDIDPKTGIVSNRTNLVIGIVDRLNILKRNSFMELMLKTDTKSNINLVEEMQKNQLITIRMPESMFTTQGEKDVFSIYMLTKLFLAAQIRADNIRDKSKRTRCTIVFDELYQTNYTEKFLTSKLSQLAKFCVRPMVSAHYLSQLKYMKEEMKNGANPSYVLISGCGKENYKELKDELLPYTEEDLMSLPRYHALCMIRAKDQYAKFVTKLPPEVKNRLNSSNT